MTPSVLVTQSYSRKQNDKAFKNAIVSGSCTRSRLSPLNSKLTVAIVNKHPDSAISHNMPR